MNKYKPIKESAILEKELRSCSTREGKSNDFGIFKVGIIYKLLTLIKRDGPTNHRRGTATTTAIAHRTHGR